MLGSSEAIQNHGFLCPLKPNKIWRPGFDEIERCLQSSGGAGQTQQAPASSTGPPFLEKSGKYIGEGAQSRVSDKEQRCKDLIFFFLLHCFKNSYRLESSSLLVGSIVFPELYWSLPLGTQLVKNLAAMQETQV